MYVISHVILVATKIKGIICSLQSIYISSVASWLQCMYVCKRQGWVNEEVCLLIATFTSPSTDTLTITVTILQKGNKIWQKTIKLSVNTSIVVIANYWVWRTSSNIWRSMMLLGVKTKSAGKDLSKKARDVWLVTGVIQNAIMHMKYTHSNGHQIDEERIEQS